jgi:DNA-binding MarR family transcriptional regulator
MRRPRRSMEWKGKEVSITQPLGIEECTCFAARKAARQITRFYDAQLEPAGLRVTQFLTLAALDEARSVAVNALAERLDIERTAMGKMLGFLARDGLIRVDPRPTDGRSRLVSLTDEGRRRHAEASPLWIEAQRRFEQLNGAENVATLRQGLADMVFADASSSKKARSAPPT